MNVPVDVVRDVAGWTWILMWMWMSKCGCGY